MKIEDCKKDDLKEVSVSSRITLKMKKFIEDKKISPSKIMREALINLGFQEE